MSRSYITFIFLFFLASSLKADNTTTSIKELPALSKAESWVVEKPEKKWLSLEQGEGGIIVKVNVTKKDIARLLLKKPIDIPEKHELVWNAIAKDIRPLFLYALVKDSNGKLYRFHQSSRSFCKKSMFLGGYFSGGLFRHGDVLMRVFGLRDFQRESFSLAGQKGHPRPPVPPLQFAGLEITAERDRLEKNTLYFRDFRFSDIDHKKSKLYYQFNNQERFVELDGPPSLSYGDILGKAGYQHWATKGAVIDWSVRSKYEGQPFLVGSQEIKFNPDTPRELELAQDVVFPITAPGTYWVNVKYRTFNKGKISKIAQKDYRLYIINGEGEAPKNIIPEQAKIGKSNIRIAPDRETFLWKEDENWLLLVRYSAADGTKCRVAVKDKTGKVLKEKEIVAETDTVINELDLNDLPAGIYEIEATQLKDGVFLDRSLKSIGKREKFNKKDFKYPHGVASYQELINGKNPLFYFEAHISNHNQDDNKKIMEVMKVVQPITRNSEIHARWRDIERMPGLYDFRALDELLDYAESIGTKIQFDISFGGPEWLPSHYTQNPEGKIFGHNSYLFHGARLNKYQSQLIRQAALEYVKALVLHFRHHPALQSYYFLIEHPGEAPYKGWYEGFDKFTLDNFREAMHKKYQTVDKANKAWRTEFANFADIMPPYPNSLAANQFWLDWIDYREQGVGEFREECVDIVRKYDPKRMIMMYGHGSEKMRDRGVLTANGGCAKISQQSLGMVAVADAGMPQRAEEISVTNWASFPNQLDVSLFTMMMGGGQNSHCKMFFPTAKYLRNRSLDDLRNNKNALDQFEKFIPVWKELRPGRSLAGDVRYFVNQSSDRVYRKSTYNGGGDPWFTMFFLHGQVPFWIAPGKDWKESKLIVIPDSKMRVMQDSVVEELAEYVKSGGNLLMFAASGRYSMESGNSNLNLLRSHLRHDLKETRKMNSLENDWLLLRKFGFKPPEEPRKHGLKLSPVGVKGTPFEEYGKMGLLRDVWGTDKDNGTTLATGRHFLSTYPLLTMKKYGKGRVFVIWASTQIPFGKSNQYEDSLIRGVAKMVGASLPVESSSRLLYVNLLKHKDEDTWFLLVSKSGKNIKEVSEETVKLLLLPNGKYQVKELISNKSHGTFASETLKKDGLKNKLKFCEVAIFKIKKLP